MNEQQFNELFELLGSGNVVQKPKELWILIQAIQAISVKRILEIGTANGGTLKFFEQAAGLGGKIVTVDAARGDVVENLPVDFSNPLCDLQLIGGYSQASETIEKVKTALGEGPIDFLYIDGDHKYESVKADFDNYHGLVRPGGIIGFHDINHPPVKQLWDEIDIPHQSKVYHNYGLGTGILHL